jgi:hypothetical protein
VSIVGQVEFEGVVLSTMSQYDMLVVENEIASMLGSVLTVSVNSYKQTSTGLVVTFGASVAAERYNVDATVLDNIAPLVVTLKHTLSHNLANNLYLSSNEKILEAGYPRSAIMDAKSANLLSVEYVGVKYLSPLPADKTVIYPQYEAESTDEQSTMSVLHISLTVVGSIVGVAFVVGFVGMKIRAKRLFAARFNALPTSSEHSVDFSEDRLTPFDLGMDGVEEEVVISEPSQ